jgi:GT2 family glycosyltransferase
MLSKTEIEKITNLFDLEWYCSNYPDVILSGMTPLEHYLSVGLSLGRNPSINGRQYIAELLGNNTPEITCFSKTSLDLLGKLSYHPELNIDTYIDEFDTEYYLTAYPDVDISGMDPAKHYQEYGKNEGRKPNPGRKPREGWAAHFNATWYTANNADLGEYAGDALGHFINIGLKEGRSPNPERDLRKKAKHQIDSIWYLERNPDVREAGLDPLSHYLSVGIYERRRPNKDAVLECRSVLAAQIHCLKDGFLGESVALFITHTSDGNIKPHIKKYLQSLKLVGISTILIIATDNSVINLPEDIQAIVDVIYCRANEGFDFAAWAHILRIRSDLYQSKVLFLLNDSVLGPVNDLSFKNIINKVFESEADFIGLTENWDRGWHIQSYFLAIKERLLASNDFQDYFNAIVSYYDKEDVINEYETRMSRYFVDKGFATRALFSFPDKKDATSYQWKTLLSKGFPFLKLRGIWAGGQCVDFSGWRKELSALGYDVSLADKSLAQLIAGSRRKVRSSDDHKADFRRELLAELHSFFASGEVIDLPANTNPTVSIILVLYNQAELTLRCLKSIVETVDEPAEVIIVDNSSSDDTQYLISRLRNARVVSNAENLHFLRASNQGASFAKGKAILLLNNDTRLTQHSVKYGLESLFIAENIGAVGGKLILPDGTLQEAGSVIFNDGSCIGYGRGRLPDDFSCNYRRDVDFCSGAYLIIKRDLFERLGGFNTVYAPAYYEETDLCMRIWAAGFRVVFDPRIVVHHYEFGSSGNFEAAAQLMRRNHETFVTRHKSSLQRFHPSPRAEDYLLRFSRRRGSARLLLIDDMLPFVNYGAGYPRANRLLVDLVSEGFLLTHYPMVSGETLQDVMKNCPIDVEYVLGEHRPTILDFIEQRAGYYDGIIISRPGPMKIIRDHFYKIPHLYRNTVLIYDAEAVCSPRDLQQRVVNGEFVSNDDFENALKYELSLSDISDLTLTVNSRDAKYFIDADRPNVKVLSHSVKINPTSSTFHERSDFLFVGRLCEDGSPNVDGLLWFANQVMPKLDIFIGSDYKLIVAGRANASQLNLLNKDRILFLGLVDDLYDLYNKARVFIASPRYAAGIPLKVCEAAAYGLPTVVSPILEEQLGWRSGALLAGANADEFADKCRLLYTNPDLWDEVRRNALDEISIQHNADKFKADLLSHLRSVGLKSILN